MRSSCAESRVKDLGFEVQGLGIRVGVNFEGGKGLGFRVWGWQLAKRFRESESHTRTLIFCKLALNQNYHTFTQYC